MRQQELDQREAPVAGLARNRDRRERPGEPAALAVPRRLPGHPCARARAHRRTLAGRVFRRRTRLPSTTRSATRRGSWRSKYQSSAARQRAICSGSSSPRASCRAMQRSRGASTSDDHVEVAAQRGPRDVATLHQHHAARPDDRDLLSEAVGVPVVAAVAGLLAAHERREGLVAQPLPVEQEVDRLERREGCARALGQRPVEVVALDDREVVAQQGELGRQGALAGAARPVDPDDDRRSLVRCCVDRRRDELGRGEVVA